MRGSSKLPEYGRPDASLLTARPQWQKGSPIPSGEQPAFKAGIAAAAAGVLTVDRIPRAQGTEHRARRNGVTGFDNIFK